MRGRLPAKGWGGAAGDFVGAGSGVKRTMEGFGKRARLGAALIAVLCLASLTIVAGAPANAQGPAAVAAEKSAERTAPSDAESAAASVKELEALARTLENDEVRKNFLTTLKGLIAARKAAAEKEKKPSLGDGIAGRIAAAVSHSVQAFGDRVASVVGVLKDAPHLIPWLESWVINPDKRDRLIGLIWRFLTIVGLGMGAQYLFRRFTGRWRGSLEKDEDTAIAGRVVRWVLRTLLLFGSALAYGAGAYGGFVALPMSGVAGEVLLVGAASFLTAKLILAATRMIIASRMPPL